MADSMFGYKIRSQLFPGEESYFRTNPHVTGMASETNDIILNPFASGEVNRDAVARNEAFRLHLKNSQTVPQFQLTDDQRRTFVGTPYETDENALRETIAARIYSNDPSAKATPQQQEWVNQFISGALPPTVSLGEILKRRR